MNKEEYSKLVKQRSKNPNIVEDAFISFLSGGLVGALGEVLTEMFLNMSVPINEALAYTSILFILLAVVLTGFGVFDKLISKYKFGLIIPITGFAHSVASSIMDYRKDGLITGMGSNMFKLAGSVILYGTVSAFICTIIKVIIYG